MLNMTASEQSKFDTSSFDSEIYYINPKDLEPNPDQPRKHFDTEKISELAESIKSVGILQPLLVNDLGGQKYEIVAGERRWRASLLLGLELVPCILKKRNVSTSEAALIENIQRQDLDPIEEAFAYSKLLIETRCTVDDLAKRVGKSRSAISNSLRLLKLPESVQTDIQTSKISAGHAKVLCNIERAEDLERIRDAIVADSLSVRKTEQIVRTLKKNAQQKNLKNSGLPSDVRLLADHMKSHLGTKVRISGSSQSGKIEISYYSLEDLDRISAIILGLGSLSKPQSRDAKHV